MQYRHPGAKERVRRLDLGTAASAGYPLSASSSVCAISLALTRRKALPLGEQYLRYARIWFCLGVPVFSSVIVIFWLMTAKP